jgi:protein-disulfide isomerase
MKMRLGESSNVLVILTAGYFLFSPNGPVGGWIQTRNAVRKQARAVQEHWPELTGSGGVRGDLDGPVELVVFTDYQCQFCNEAESVLNRLAEIDASLTVVYRNYPLKQIHPRAQEAALAVICAESTGEFSAVHERLFADDVWQGAAQWGTVLATAGVADTTKLVACMSGQPARARLDQDLALAQLIGVSSTPSFVVSSGVARGLQTLDELQALLR